MNTKTIDEKAKAYDEAIKRIENIKTGKCETTFMFTEGLFEYIFPELKESEDERIMGNIIATIHLYYGEPLEDEAKEMIAWLERQGKNNMGISEATKQKLEDNLNRALEKETPESFNKFLDEQGEQMPADTEKGANGNEREIPNFAWSEEDKKIIIQIVDAVGDYFPTPVADKIKNWLKSLKERVQPQSKQEWNEDTQQWIDAIIKDYEGWYDADKDHRATIQVKINILKSLRPQSTWKPSDEQIDALVSAIDIMIDNRGAGDKKTNLLSGLYHELKAL